MCEVIQCSGSALVQGMVEVTLPWLDNGGPNPSAPTGFWRFLPVGGGVDASEGLSLLLASWKGLCPACSRYLLRDRQMLQALSQSSLPVLGRSG